MRILPQPVFMVFLRKGTDMKNTKIKKLVYAGVCLALAQLLPLLTGQIPQLGNKISPMHIPALLCGFLSGPVYGAAVGFLSPLLRFLLFGMPPIFPTGTAMAFELMTYGLFTGLFYKLFSRKIRYIYVNLIASMFIGRLVWGLAMVVLNRFWSIPFSMEIFIASGFVNAIPGIIIHIALIPLIVIALKKARLMPNE